MEKVGVPTFSGIKENAISYALGAGGGLLYSISTSIFGTGLIGGLLAACVVGATIKGVRGEMLSTMLGFMTIVGGMGASQASSASTQRAVI